MTNANDIPTLGYEYNDGGRQASGRKGNANDCAVRAMAIITDIPYTDCYKRLAAANQVFTGKRSARNGVHKKASDRVYADAGLYKVKLPAGPKPTYAQAYAEYGDCLVTTSHHICALVDGKRCRIPLTGVATNGTAKPGNARPPACGCISRTPPPPPPPARRTGRGAGSANSQPAGAPHQRRRANQPHPPEWRCQL